jgi:hypothetical protein
MISPMTFLVNSGFCPADRVAGRVSPRRENQLRRDAGLSGN